MAHPFHPEALHDPLYTPDKLINKLYECAGVNSDFKLSHVIECNPSTLSRVRHRKMPIPHSLLVTILDHIPSLTMADIRTAAGLPLVAASKIAQPLPNVQK